MADRHVVWCFRLVTDSTSTGFSVAALDLGEVFQESGILYGLIALTGIFLFKNIISAIMINFLLTFAALLHLTIYLITHFQHTLIFCASILIM